MKMMDIFLRFTTPSEDARRRAAEDTRRKAAEAERRETARQATLHQEAAHYSPGRTVNVGKVLAWFVVVLVVGSIIASIVGYIVGFRADMPDISAPDVPANVAAIFVGIILVATMIFIGWNSRKALVVLIGALAVGGLVGIIQFQTTQPSSVFLVVGEAIVGATLITVIVFLMPHLPWDWLWPEDEEISKTLIWASVSIVAGGGIGYAIGFRNAQSVLEVLAGVGTIVVGIIVIGLAAVIGLSMGSSDNRRRY